MAEGFSRRDFLHRASTGIGASVIAAQWPMILATSQLACQAHDNGEDFIVFSVSEALLADALASMIIPDDDSPGAHTAGVVYFIDRALDTFSVGNRDIVIGGLADLTAKVDNTFSSSSKFSDLAFIERSEVVEEIENTTFFGIFRVLTVQGMFSHPRHGGNMNKSGWQLLGFDDRHTWTPPFGYYDAQIMDQEDSK